MLTLKPITVSFTYKDEQREVEPHLIGMNTKDKLMMSGWQTSGERPGWRLFELDKINGEVFEKESFTGTREGYNPEDKRMKQIYARV